MAKRSLLHANIGPLWAWMLGIWVIGLVVFVATDHRVTGLFWLAFVLILVGFVLDMMSRAVFRSDDNVEGSLSGKPARHLVAGMSLGICGLVAFQALGGLFGWLSLHLLDGFLIMTALMLLWFLVWLASLAVFLGGVVRHLIHRAPTVSARVMTLCVTTVLGAGVLWTPLSPLALYHRTRMAGFHRLAERSEGLVDAIRRYEADHGSAPNDLSRLVPDYLDRMPRTGLGAYPDYNIWLRETDGNSWVLMVPTSRGPLNFDCFVYYPNGNYPETGWGGWLEPVGDWAYVHE